MMDCRSLHMRILLNWTSSKLDDWKTWEPWHTRTIFCPSLWRINLWHFVTIFVCMAPPVTVLVIWLYSDTAVGEMCLRHCNTWLRCRDIWIRCRSRWSASSPTCVWFDPRWVLVSQQIQHLGNSATSHLGNQAMQAPYVSCVLIYTWSGVMFHYSLAHLPQYNNFTLRRNYSFLRRITFNLPSLTFDKDFTRCILI